MTTKQLLPPGSDKDFAVVHSTLTDSKVTAELLAATDRPGSKYRIPLLGEARRIGHTLNTLDRIKARHDALVAVRDAAKAYYNFTRSPEPQGFNNQYNMRAIRVGEALFAALEAAK